MAYVELQVTTNYSFLRGASHPREIVKRAADYGYRKIAVTDHHTFAGLVRAHVAAKDQNITLIPGCRLDFQDAPSLLAYPTDTAAYSRLCNLLSLGNLRTEKGKCLLNKADLYQYAKGNKFVVISPQRLNHQYQFNDDFLRSIREYREALGSDLYLGVTRAFNGVDAQVISRLSELAGKSGTSVVATGDVYYHDSRRRPLQDVMTCIHEKCTIQNAGYRVHPNAQRHLKRPEEMGRLFRQYPDAILRTEEIAEACTFTLDSLKYIYPSEVIPDGLTAIEQLERLTWEGAISRYGEDIPQNIGNAITHELDLIREMGYAPYFLTVRDAVRFCKENGILCQGRGSAANSVTCWCLDITCVDPTKFHLLFERFLSRARKEPPDIDLDIEHERREEVIQYIYKKYGRERAAIIATVTQVHEKGAIRDVGRAMGLSVDAVNNLSGSVRELTQKLVAEQKPEARGTETIPPLMKKVLALTNQYIGFPRQLGQHTGGFVITDQPLIDLVPIFNARMKDRTNIEWDKYDVDALGWVKVDFLGLGMLTCIRKAFNLLKIHYNLDLTLQTVPQDDPAVYEMCSVADTVGLFQIESRAQQAMLPRIRPKCFYDLVIEVAIVRPGPIQGGMVHPYIRRRNGEESVTYPSEEVRKILNRTLGVPLFQEQVMKLSMVCAGFTAAEADELRSSMATFKQTGAISKFRQRLIDGMVARGYSLEYALQIWAMIEGFGSYGFPESHAASFAQLVYISAWIKKYYPDVYAAAIINSQPMGFYTESQLIRDAMKNGVVFLGVDVNLSMYDYTLETKTATFYDVRIGFRQIKGFCEEDAEILLRHRMAGYASIHQLHDTGLSLSALQLLADADAFRSIGLDRRQALWEVSALADRPIGAFKDTPSESTYETGIHLPAMTAAEHVVQDYASTRLSIKGHPVAFLRDKLNKERITLAKDLRSGRNRSFVKVAGLVAFRQRPGTAKGVCFITLEDETSNANVIVWPALFDKYYKEITGCKFMMVEGELQIVREVIHVIVKRVYNYDYLLGDLAPTRNDELTIPHSRADEKNDAPFISQELQDRHHAMLQARKLPKGRNFK